MTAWFKRWRQRRQRHELLAIMCGGGWTSGSGPRYWYACTCRSNGSPRRLHADACNDFTSHIEEMAR
jgi:hypothetical protein